jgi:GntR family transcriptional regulator
MTAVSSHRSPQASGTRFAELASALVKEFVGVRNVVGSLLRTEHELAERHRVSHHTARAALSLLQDLGYVWRKKAVGTIVESANPSASYTQSFSTAEDLARIRLSFSFLQSQVRTSPSRGPAILSRSGDQVGRLTGRSLAFES